MAVKKAKLHSPQGLHFKSDDGLLVPSAFNDKEAHLPLDFTSISSREVGRQHSAWSVRHAYLIYLCGILRSEIGNTKYDLKNLEAEWLEGHRNAYKLKYQLEAAMRRSKRIRRLRKALVTAESRLTRYEALALSYQDLREAASREISRRLNEKTSKY